MERPALKPNTEREARLVIAEHLSRRDNLCGAWWPRTRLVGEELPAMLMASTPANSRTPQELLAEAAVITS